MKSRIFSLLLAVCLLASITAVKVAAVTARDGEVGDVDGVVTDATGSAGATPTVTMPTGTVTAPATSAPTTAPQSTVAPATTAPVTTVDPAIEDREEGGRGILAIALAAVAAVAIVTLVVILVPRMRSGKQ